MAIHYVEFDTNSHNLLADLRTQILLSSDWARLTPDDILLSSSAATSVNGTVLTFASTAGSGLAIGSIIRIDDGATREYRTITAMTATTITVAAMTYAHASAIPIRWGNELYKATTTRGAQMVIDLSETHLNVTSNALAMAVYHSHDGTVGTGKALRYLYWRTNNGTATHPLHVILSISKEHFFLAIEGPRGTETGTNNSQYGSLRNYVFLDDLVPYDAGDTNPVVFAGGAHYPFYDGGFGYYSHIGHTSRNLADTSYWTPTRLASLEFPKGGWGDAVNMQRQRSIDNKFILAPYVAFADDSGMRGRLASFFFAGWNVADQYEVPVPPVGTKVEYQGQWYKLIAVNKSEASRNVWAQFGAVTNNNGTIYMRSPIVAVPCLP